MREVSIIGAGPAGSAAALMFARRGWNVSLIEQHRFPREKVCGECLSALGLDVLKRLGLREKLLAAGGVELNETVLHCADGDYATLPLPRPMMGISRAVLDSLLLDSARSAGASIRQPARCEKINARADAVEISIRDLERNSIKSFTSDLVIIADGKGALPGPTPVATGDIGIKSHWIGLAGKKNAVEMFGCRGCYGGLAPIEGNRWNAAFSVPAERVREHRGDLIALFAELMEENPSLARRLAGAVRAGPWLASPLPRFSVRKDWPPRVIFLGNAAAALEPIGGEGMGLALRSAELAVEYLDKTGDTGADVNYVMLQRQFTKLWNLRRLTCRAAGMFVSSTNTATLAVESMKASEQLMSLAMRGLGKTHDAKLF